MLVTGQLMAHLLDGKAAPQESTSFTVLGEDQIGGVECSCSADTGGLLTTLCHIEGDTGLTLGSVINLIGLVHGDHRVVHFQNKVVVDLSVVTWGHDIALFIHDTEALDFVEGALKVHLVSESMFKHFRVDLVHGAEVALGSLDH